MQKPCAAMGWVERSAECAGLASNKPGAAGEASERGGAVQHDERGTGVFSCHFHASRLDDGI